MRLAKRQVTMSTIRTAILAASLLVPVAARAEDAPRPLPAVGDVIYKGVVGKALDALPMDPAQRIVLQRTNAVVSSTLTGRSLSVWAGLTNPILLVGGLVWGLFAASKIKANEARPGPDTTIVESETRDWRLEAGVVFLETRHFPPDQW